MIGEKLRLTALKKKVTINNNNKNTTLHTYICAHVHTNTLNNEQAVEI